MRFGCLLLICLAGADGAQAATFLVSNIDDAGPGSLRQAMLAANAAPAPPHRIVFDAGFPPQGMIELFSSLPPVQVETEIDGAGRNPVVTVFDAGNSFPLLRAERGLTLRGLSLNHGRGSGKGGCLSGEGSGTTHELVLDRVTFSACTTVAVGAGSALGGAVSWSANAPVSILGSVFDGNGAVSLGTGAALGGAIHAAGPLHIAASSFHGNRLNGGFAAGGAVSVQLALPGALEIRDSVFTDNSAEPDPVPSPSGIGGALSLDCAANCSARMERNYFGANRSRTAGAVFVRANAGVASFLLHNTSFVGNRAVDQGGAVLVQSAQLEVRHATFFDNAAAAGGHVYAALSSVGEFSNSVLAPVAAGSGASCSIGAAAALAVGNYRSAMDFSCSVSVPGSAAVADFRIAGVNGAAALPVLAFDASSAVVDGGDTARCLPDDALGAARPQDGNGDGSALCDAGAYEHARDERIFEDGFDG